MRLLASILLGIASFIFLTAVEDVSAQTMAQAGPSQQPQVPAFQQEQQTLMKERQALIDQGATPQQLAAWKKQNASRLIAQKQRLDAVSATSPSEIRPTNFKPMTQSNASQTQKDFQTAQANLANARNQIHNQIVAQLAASLQTASPVQVGQLEQQEMQAFRLAHAGDLQLQRQRIRALDNQLTPMPMCMPAEVEIPSDATPQMIAFLKARGALMNSQAQIWNQNLNADAVTRQAAIQAWRRQNAGQIRQLRKAKQSLFQAESAN